MSSLLIAGCHVGGGVYGEIVSQPLPPISTRVFFYIGVTYPVFGFLSEEHFLICSCRFAVSVGEGEVRVLLCCHFELELSMLLFLQIQLLVIIY